MDRLVAVADVRLAHVIRLPTVAGLLVADLMVVDLMEIF